MFKLVHENNKNLFPSKIDQLRYVHKYVQTHPRDSFKNINKEHFKHVLIYICRAELA